jgi:hypothetical protein
MTDPREVSTVTTTLLPRALAAGLPSVIVGIR